MFTATAAEIVETDQPNSSRSGSMRTPGTARNAAAPTRARNVTAATHQAGWIRCGRTAVSCGSWTVTPDSIADGTCPERGPPANLRSTPAVLLTRCDGELTPSGVGERFRLVEWGYRRRPRSS